MIDLMSLLSLLSLCYSCFFVPFSSFPFVSLLLQNLHPFVVSRSIVEKKGIFPCQEIEKEKEFMAA